jgi:hypothetical protein
MRAEDALAIAKKYTKDTMIGAGAIKGDKGDKGDTGPNGEKGEDGTTYAPSIGTVTTVDSGESASVTVAVDDTTKEAVFSFEIPKGENGESDTEKVNDLSKAVGDITTLQVASVNDLVSAINLLYNSFMTGITYADKKLTISYRNGQKFAIDISAIITDTKIGEFSDVSDTGITDGQVLAFDASTSKYLPKSIDASDVLQDAKDYTDEKIAKMTHMGAISVDAKPTYADGTITYVKGGETKTTTNTETWFYYTVNGTAYQTIWIDSVEFTVTVSGSVDFDDFVSKTNDVTSTYTGKNADKTKIPNIGALDDLYTLLSNVIGTKVNTSDIVDSLVSDAADKPLAAKQGKTLNTALVGHATNTDMHITSAERTTWNSANTSINNALDASVSGSLAAQIASQKIEKGMLSGEIDFDNILETGCYDIVDCKNTPLDEYGCGTLLVFKSDRYAKVQIYIPHRTTKYSMVVRCNYETWNSWQGIERTKREITKLILANSKIENNKHVFAFETLKGVYVCYGYIHVTNTIQSGETIFEISQSTAEGATLILTESVNNNVCCLLYNGNGKMALMNKNMEIGYYYVTGTIVNA